MKFDKRDKHGRPIWYNDSSSKKVEDKEATEKDIDLKDLTKDELNDLAAKEGIDVDTKMLKKDMIKKILEEL